MWGEPEQIHSARVSADFFPALGVEPMLGRAFTADEDRPGAAGVAVISHRFRRDKSNAVLSFFGFAGKHPVAVTPADVKAWQADMEGKGLAQTTVYTRICHLSSFFRWSMKDSSLGQYLESNPVSYAHPKAPKPRGPTRLAAPSR